MNWLWISGLIAIVDQVTKQVADSNLDLRAPLEVIPNLTMKLCYNRGAAFSILSNAGGWRRRVLMTLSLVVSITLVYWLHEADKNRKFLRWGLALIIGGAVGNLIDRSLYGYVIDFIDVYYAYWHWPAFNIADSAVSVGAALLIIDMIMYAEPN